MYRGDSSGEDDEPPRSSSPLHSGGTRGYREPHYNLHHQYAEKSSEMVDNIDMGALDLIKQAEYWKERAINAMNKNQKLQERNAILENDVIAWERRTKRIEKRSERLQNEIEEMTKTAGRRKNISNNFEVSNKEVEEVANNPSSDLKKLMQSSFRQKWSKKRLAGLDTPIDDNSDGDETVAARKYIDEFLNLNDRDASKASEKSKSGDRSAGRGRSSPSPARRSPSTSPRMRARSSSKNRRQAA